MEDGRELLSETAGRTEKGAVDPAARAAVQIRSSLEEPVHGSWLLWRQASEIQVVGNPVLHRVTSIAGFVEARARFEEAHPCDARATRFGQHTALALARLTACFPHVARIDLAPCLAAGCRSACRVLRGARVARDALQAVAVWTPTPHANGDRSHRINIGNIDRVEGNSSILP
jgi:hypothetical protein